jgi:2-polyprenyl-3-methyl-5-hydroxy-6-metoxy-1,4-benzoquinol methylase
MNVLSWLKGVLPLSPFALKSCLCTEATLMSPAFQDWADRLKEARGHRHRKVWEWCFICQALAERGMLAPGKVGLGFAVGQEPLTALFAARGARVLATDLYSDEALARGWVQTDQHATGLAAINQKGICDESRLRGLVEFRFADMNHISREWDDSFDFVWSSCAFEHLGSLEHGKRFVVNAMNCLKPGGIAVHTTEYNLSSDSHTIETGETVLYRQRDIHDIVARLRNSGHRIEVDLTPGKTTADAFVDVPPYTHATHLKLKIAEYTVTSIGLVVQKAR